MWACCRVEHGGVWADGYTAGLGVVTGGRYCIVKEMLLPSNNIFTYTDHLTRSTKA